MMKVRQCLVPPLERGEAHRSGLRAIHFAEHREADSVVAANGGRPFLRAGPISGRGRYLGMLASRWSSVVDYSRLTATQGKQKGNKGDMVRQKDQGYVDTVALVFQATTSPVSPANVLFTQQVGLSRLTYRRLAPWHELYELEALEGRSR